MNEFLKKNLQENEKVLWQDRPTGIKVLEPPFKTSVLINWCLCGLFVILIAVYLVYAQNAELSMDSATKVSAVAFLCILLAFTSPILDVFRLKSKYNYYITNQRFIIIKEGSEPIMDWRDFSDVNEVGIDTLSTGNACLYINPIGNVAKMARKGITAKKPENYKSETMHFYSISKVKEAIKLIPADILITYNWSKSNTKEKAPQA